MKLLTHHVILILGLAALAVLGLAVIPEHAWDKMASGVAIIAADPVGATGAGVAIATAVGAIVAAWRRALYTPPPAGTGTTETSSSGEPRP